MQTQSSILSTRISFTLGYPATSVAVSLLFVAAFCVIESAYSTSGLIAAYRSIADSGDIVYQVVYFAYTALTIYLLFLFVLVTVTARWPAKAILLTIFAFASVVEYSYLHAVGRFTAFPDVIAAVSATPEQRSFSMSSFISLVGLIPAGALALTAIYFTPSREHRGNLRASIGLAAVLIVFFLHLSLVNRYLFDREFHTGSFSAFGQTLADIALYAPVEQLSPVVRHAVEPVENARPGNNIILIFDESIRADHLSLNGYKRRTTPYLEQLAAKGQLLNWGTAVAASTSSHPAYNAFITGLQPDDFARLEVRDINSLPTVFQYAKAAGYRTHFFDGQMMDYWGGAKDDLNYIDNFVSLAAIDNPNRVEDWQKGGKITYEDLENNQLKQWDIDAKVAGMVRAVFEGSDGNFIFVYKRGAHFPYEKNYPIDTARWRPIHRFTEQYEIPPEESLQAVLNSYDNAVKFNLDDFFKRLWDDYSRLPNRTVILYTSDHGESFFKNGRAGHGGDTTPEATVPLFAFGLNASEIDTDFKASHHNLFATLLDLMQYPENYRRSSYSRSLLRSKAADSTPRSFNTPTGKKIAFD